MNESTGKPVGIALREKSRAPMVAAERARISQEAGVEGDFRGSSPHRQVTLLDLQAWKRACNDLGRELDWKTRRANLLIDGVDLSNSKGARVRVGSVVLEVTSETEPCSRMEELEPGLLEALTPDWRGGVCCRVIEGGEVAAGEKVVLERAVAVD